MFISKKDKIMLMKHIAINNQALIALNKRVEDLEKESTNKHDSTSAKR